ncbi:MAG: zinc ribbon domain-containing protein [Gemmatimonadota bacterium]
MDSSSTVEALLSLQEIDTEIEERAARLKELMRELAETSAALEAVEDQTSRARVKVEEAEERLRTLQRSAQAGRATLKRLEARAQEVQNMKQHLAVRAEADAARRNLRMAEEDALSAMQEVEDGRAELGELEQRLAEHRARHEARGREAETERESLEAQIAVQREQRKNREIRLDGSVLRLYQKVRRGRARKALAPLTADGVCGNCFTSVPLQRQSDIRACRELEVCEGCGVILYAPSE